MKVSLCGYSITSGHCNVLPQQSHAPRTSVVATVLLCGKTECLVKLLQHQFQNCLHRLKLALKDGFLVPGGGLTEAVCVCELRYRIHKLNSALGKRDSNPSDKEPSMKTSFGLAMSWMGDPSLLAHWRPHIYEACADGLLLYISRVLMNTSCFENQYVAMVTAEDLMKKVGGGEREGVVGSMVCDPEVLDVVSSKMAAWRRALELLRLVFLSRRVQTQS